MDLVNGTSDDIYLKLGLAAAILFIFFFVWAALAIRRWNVQSAILKMGEDVAELKRGVAQLRSTAGTDRDKHELSSISDA